MAKEKKEKAPKAPKAEAGGKGLNMDVNLDFLKDIGKKKSGSGMPNKKTMNLVILEKGDNSKTTDIILIVLLVVVLIVFVKFGVLDILSDKKKAEEDTKAIQTQLEDDQELLEAYENVFKDYDHDFNAFLSEEELLLVDRAEILKMLNEALFNGDSTMQSINIKGNTVSVVLNDVSLEKTGALLESLEKQDMVMDNGVFLQTASTSKDKNGEAAISGNEQMTATFTIELDPDYKNKPPKAEREKEDKKGDKE